MRVGGTDLGFAHVGPLTSRADGDGHRVDAVVLRRAVSGSARLWEWYAASEPDQRGEDVVIELCDDAGEAVVARWVLVGARPVRWSGPTLDANARDVAMEEIELVAEGLEWSKEE